MTASIKKKLPSKIATATNSLKTKSIPTVNNNIQCGNYFNSDDYVV